MEGPFLMPAWAQGAAGLAYTQFLQAKDSAFSPFFSALIALEV